MSSFRPKRVAGLALAMLLANAPAALAVHRCPAEADQQLFELVALKTELMVVATSCRQEDRYNAFVTRFRPQLAEADRSIMRHFGGRGRRNWDSYITALANGRADLAQALGTDFCPRNSGVFNEVMALEGNDLRAYAAGKDMIPPVPGGCEAPPPPRAARHSTPARRR